MLDGREEDDADDEGIRAASWAVAYTIFGADTPPGNEVSASAQLLPPLLPQCGLVYEFHRWSNLVCSHDRSILDILKSFVPTSLT